MIRQEFMVAFLAFRLTAAFDTFKLLSRSSDFIDSLPAPSRTRRLDRRRTTIAWPRAQELASTLKGHKTVFNRGSSQQKRELCD